MVSLIYIVKITSLFVCLKAVDMTDVEDNSKVAGSQNPFDDLKYFNKSDARDVTWAHAVNNREKLEKYLKTDILMFEADVNMRFNRNDTVPVMAHPPQNDSDLTLKVFLETVSQTRKGIKLDFKSIAVEPSVILLKNVFGTGHSKPLWLNADILLGPGVNSRSNPPVDASRFINICTSTFPNATLSLGWTTGWSQEIVSEGYTQEMVEQMAKICENTTQTITFPLRAVYIRRSWKHLKWLVHSSYRYSITVWSSEGDTVNVDDLVWLTKQVDKRRLYMDLPPGLDAELERALAPKAMANDKTGFISCLVVACLSIFIIKVLMNS